MKELWDVNKKVWRPFQDGESFTRDIKVVVEVNTGAGTESECMFTYVREEGQDLKYAITGFVTCYKHDAVSQVDASMIRYNLEAHLARSRVAHGKQPSLSLDPTGARSAGVQGSRYPVEGEDESGPIAR